MVIHAECWRASGVSLPVKNSCDEASYAEDACSGRLTPNGDDEAMKLRRGQLADVAEAFRQAALCDQMPRRVGGLVQGDFQRARADLFTRLTFAAPTIETPTVFRPWL